MIKVSNIVDSHNHIGVTPKEYLFVEDLIKKMDKTKQAVAMVFPMMRGFEFSPTQFNPYSGNEYIAEAQNKYPDRIIGIAGVDPRFRLYANNRDHAKEIISPVLGEIEHAIVDLNLKGLKLHPLIHRFEINDPFIMYPVLDKLVELQERTKKILYVVVHSGGEITNTPEKIALVSKKYPMLTFAASHIGWLWGMNAFMSPIDNIVKGCENILIDFTNVPTFYLLEKMVEIFGASRIVAGSDEPFAHIEAKMALIERARISDKDKELILSGNLRKFFNI